MAHRNLIVEVEGEQEQVDITPHPVERQIATLRAAWADCVEREGFARQAITNLGIQLSELDCCISDARLRAAQPIPIDSGIAGITEHSRKKRIAQDEIESLQDAKSELLRQLARLEQEFRGYSLEKSGIRESMFRLFFNDLLQKHRPLFARIAALGAQIGLSEQMICGELFYNCNDDLTDLLRELEIVS